MKQTVKYEHIQSHGPVLVLHIQLYEYDSSVYDWFLEQWPVFTYVLLQSSHKNMLN